MTTITRYAHGLIQIDGHACDYRVEQAHDGTRVYRVARDPRDQSRELIPMRRNRYALSQPADAAAFDRDLLAALAE